MRDQATIVTSLAGPDDAGLAERHPVPRLGQWRLPSYSSRFSMKITGLSSSIALRSRPYVSAPELGMTTVSPGIWASSASRLCECWLPDDRPAAELGADHQRQRSPRRRS